MRCRRERTTGREGMGRFGIRFWAIMGRVDWFENVYDRLLYALAIKGDFKRHHVALDRQKSGDRNRKML